MFLLVFGKAQESGHWQWDYELFCILPAILAAPDRARANAEVLDWINKLGSVARCESCAHLRKANLQLPPDLRWIGNERLLGRNLSRRLRWIRTNRLVGKQFYVSLAPYVGNPIFDHELPYRGTKFPDAGFQLLALYRFWNIIEYWYPYRNDVGENWDKVLAGFIPRLALAKDRDSYEHRLMTLIAMVHDTHANLWRSMQARPPVGSCHLPVRLRFVQNQAVVTGYMDGAEGKKSGPEIGAMPSQVPSHAGRAIPWYV